MKRRAKRHKTSKELSADVGRALRRAAKVARASRSQPPKEPLPRRRPAEYHGYVKALIITALLLAGAFPAAAQTNAPIAPIPQQQNQFLRSQQIDALVRDRQLSDQNQQQEIERVQQQIDTLSDNPNVKPADLNSLRQALEQFQNEQRQSRLLAERRILQIEQQGDTARRRRWAAQFAREQETERLAQRQRLQDIDEALRRLR